MKQVVLGCVALALFACSAESEPSDSGAEISFVTSEAYRAAGFPFSRAVEVEGWVFLSGALGTVPGTTELAPGGIEGEARQTLDNIKATLADLGLGMDRIVKCTVMIADMAEWPAFNEVYKEYFEGDFPARSAFGASGLALNARVEVECMARR